MTKQEAKAFIEAFVRLRNLATDDMSLQVPNLYPAWKLEVDYKTGDRVLYNDILYKDYIDNINALGTALISVGLKGQRIGVIGENKYEWQEAYLSIVCGVGVVVPLDKALPENEIYSLIERSGIEAIFYSEKFEPIMKKIKEEKIGNIKYFIFFLAKLLKVNY